MSIDLYKYSDIHYVILNLKLITYQIIRKSNTPQCALIFRHL